MAQRFLAQETPIDCRCHLQSARLITRGVGQLFVPISVEVQAGASQEAESYPVGVVEAAGNEGTKRRSRYRGYSAAQAALATLARTQGETDRVYTPSNKPKAFLDRGLIS